MNRFEFFIARRYLRAKRRQAVISVITVISVIGVAAGVMALVIALAINNGFRSTLQRSLLGATAHVMIQEKNPEAGIENWRTLANQFRKLPHVTSVSPGLYDTVLFVGPRQSQGAVLKGVSTDSSTPPSDILAHLKQGSYQRLREDHGMPGIIVGVGLAQKTGLLLDSVVTVIPSQGELTPLGQVVRRFRFRVVGLFESGFSDLDSGWAFIPLASAQQVLSVGDVVNTVEMRLDDIYRAREVGHAAEQIAGPKLTANTWMEQYHQILSALSMEKMVTAVTIGLIQLVAGLNILITLIMMVMEKNRDIAVLMSMGARRNQIRTIFMYQGLLIGVTGTAAGLLLGYALSYLADHYRWLRLDDQVYALSYVPFSPRLIDGLWIAATAILVSFVATIYPARTATRIAPVEALRYE